MPKRIQIRPNRKMPKKYISRTEQEQCYVVAKKVLRHFELDPELIDVFTKKQKERLLKVWNESPIVKPEKERTVPRQYLRNIQAEMHKFMKNNFWGNPENQLTYSELAIYGMSFLLNLSNMYIRDAVFVSGTPQEETAKLICGKFNMDDIYYKGFKEVLNEIWYMIRCYSRVNFRMYGFIYTFDNIRVLGGLNVKMKILVTAHESESKKFIYNNVERKAFRLLITDAGIYKPAYASIKRSDIFPNTKNEERLNVYIQSHVLQRFKQRLDAFKPEIRNLLIQHAFTTGLTLRSNGKQILFACSIDDDDNPAGYFTSFVQGNDIVINTFLPVTSENTPEGKKLQELLQISKEEIIYLGMDKISFFFKVDFELIPVLKQALIDSEIWKTKLALDEIRNSEESDFDDMTVDMNKTMFVKNYFEKHRLLNDNFSDDNLP